MREIKFRAWDKELPKRGLFGVDSMVVLWGGSGRYEVMQYTGLKDKNGKDIYEGDIARLTCGCGYTENLPIETRDGYNGFFAKAHWQHNWDNNQLALGWTERDAEVIGNIYEHSYLLEGQK